MKKLLVFSLLLLGACAKKNEAPTYSDFTPISGQFMVVDDGFVRYNHRDTTAVLANLQLRINRGSVQDVYEFQGRRSAHEIDNLQIIVDHSRTGTGPWTGLETRGTCYVDGKPGAQSGSSNSGTLSATGNTFAASFDHAGLKGTLK